MIKKMGKTLTVLAALPVAISLGLATSVEAGYLTSSSGPVSVNSYKTCWKASGGMAKKIEACGDKMAMKPMMDKKPMAPADADNDGVMDNKDLCLGTPAGSKVDADGCAIIDDVTIDLNADEFEFDSAVLTPIMETALTDVAMKIKASKGTENLNIIGHTDSVGGNDYNQGLSERRAASVATFLESHGISAGNMSTSGMGESSPAAGNDTKDGRSHNRRVEIKTN